MHQEIATRLLLALAALVAVAATADAQCKGNCKGDSEINVLDPEQACQGVKDCDGSDWLQHCTRAQQLALLEATGRCRGESCKCFCKPEVKTRPADGIRCEEVEGRGKLCRYRCKAVCTGVCITDSPSKCLCVSTAKDRRNRPKAWPGDPYQENGLACVLAGDRETTEVPGECKSIFEEADPECSSRCRKFIRWRCDGRRGVVDDYGQTGCPLPYVPREGPPRDR